MHGSALRVGARDQPAPRLLCPCHSQIGCWG
jgi:hypothetical protein